ncbi:MAG: hypothetical protein ACLFVE_16055 [Chitinispirillaceae bacterium]
MSKNIISTKSKRSGHSIFTLVQKGADLYVACTRDRAELEPQGLAWSEVLRMYTLSKECFSLHGDYQNLLADCRRQTARIPSIANRLLKLRSGITRELHRADRMHPGCTGLPVFRNKPSRNELVQNLYDLHYLICKNQKTLSEAGFDTSLGKEAQKSSGELFELLGDVANMRADARIMRAKRDEKLWELYTLIKDICSLGRQVFSNDRRAVNYRFSRPNSRR